MPETCIIENDPRQNSGSALGCLSKISQFAAFAIIMASNAFAALLFALLQLSAFPALQKAFAEMLKGAALPALSRIVFAGGPYFWLLPAGLAALTVALFAFKRFGCAGACLMLAATFALNLTLLALIAAGMIAPLLATISQLGK